MEIHSFIATHFRSHYKKLLLLGTATLTLYLLKKYMDKKKEIKPKQGKRKIKEFPTIEEIQKFIEELPFDAVSADKSITLKDLLGELSEFSEDEDWKELIASVHTMYEDNANRIQEEETASIMSIYEDPNVITLHGAPRVEEIAKNLGNKEEILIKLPEGQGDAKFPLSTDSVLKDVCEPDKPEDENTDLETSIKSSGDGDNAEMEKSNDSSAEDKKILA